MSKIIINNKCENIMGGGLRHGDIEELKIVCDTSNGKKEVVVYVNGEAIFGRDFSRKIKMIYNHVATYED